MPSKELTPKQIEIITLLYRFRFLNRHHIQKLLHHTDHKRINTWLKDLSTQSYIGKIYSTSFSERIKPAIYYLQKKSRKLLLEEHEEITRESLRYMYTEGTRSSLFITHHLLLADMYLSFAQKIQDQQGTLYFFTKADLVGTDDLLQPYPDAYVTIEDVHKSVTRYFLEIVDDGVPRYAIRKRVDQYIDYAQSGQWLTAKNHLFPAIVLICPNTAQQAFARRYIQIKRDEGELNDALFYITTRETILGDVSLWESA